MAIASIEKPPSPSPSPFSLLQYPEMIMQSIESLNDANGSNKTAIAEYIESIFGKLPAAHLTLLSYHLNIMSQSGQLLFVKNNYMKPDSNLLSARTKRCRGRPVKAKDPDAKPSVVIFPARPRGRPRKHKDPLAPPPTESVTVSSGRPRGRPRKKVKTTVASDPARGATRGRGRPPKVIPAVEPVGC